MESLLWHLEDWLRGVSKGLRDLSYRNIISWIWRRLRKCWGRNQTLITFLPLETALQLVQLLLLGLFQCIRLFSITPKSRYISQFQSSLNQTSSKFARPKDHPEIIQTWCHQGWVVSHSLRGIWLEERSQKCENIANQNQRNSRKITRRVLLTTHQFIRWWRTLKFHLLLILRWFRIRETYLIVINLVNNPLQRSRIPSSRNLNNKRPSFLGTMIKLMMYGIMQSKPLLIDRVNFLIANQKWLTIQNTKRT